MCSHHSGWMAYCGSDSHVKWWPRVPVEQYLDMFKVAGLFIKSRGAAHACCLSHSINIEVTLVPTLFWELGCTCIFRPMTCYEGFAYHKAWIKILRNNGCWCLANLTIYQVDCFKTVIPTCIIRPIPAVNNDSKFCFVCLIYKFVCTYFVEHFFFWE